MTIESAKFVKELYEKRETLLTLQEISRNYDFEMKASFQSVHNNNRAESIRRECSLPQRIKDEILEYINDQLNEVNKKIDDLVLFGV